MAATSEASARVGVAILGGQRRKWQYCTDDTRTLAVGSRAANNHTRSRALRIAGFNFKTHLAVVEEELDANASVVSDLKRFADSFGHLLGSSLAAQIGCVQLRICGYAFYGLHQPIGGSLLSEMLQHH